MKIEIAEPGRMTQTGSSLLKLIQNNDMPLLDLLVRESIQNSLDAYKYDSSYVEVEFIEGVFETKEFNKHLEGVEERLNDQYKDKIYKYLAIRDSNTVGLTGPLHYDDVEENNYGNLLKLIYEISKPQENQGSGGSWGLGKTVYFRIGIGIVVYYSRIKISDSKYESRLAVSFVEDENNNNSVIPKYNGKAKRGIAWWGYNIGENKTRPLTDNVEIEKILNIFGVKPYQGDKTGSTIIIPYINENKLLTYNVIEHKDSFGEVFKPYWSSKISDYLSIAVQKWYTPRLNNDKYQYGKWLKVSINSKKISYNDMEPFFKVVQGLYNRAMCRKNDFDDFIKGINVEFKIINIRNFLETTDSGAVAYIKISREQLLQIVPHNKPTPYVYINTEQMSSDTNKAIVMYTRKPGMVVSYEIIGPWTDLIPTSNKNEYIIGFFVLNSSNNFRKNIEDLSLEEYIRKGELADHTSWNDMSLKNSNPRIVSKIQTHIKNAISSAFVEEPEEPVDRLNSGLGKLFGDILLPPESFGKGPSAPDVSKGKTGSVGVTISRKGIKLHIDTDNIEYSPEGLYISFVLKTTSPIKNVFLNVEIVLESGTISADDWENSYSETLPFKLQAIYLDFLSINKNKVNVSSTLNKLIAKSSYENIIVELMKTENKIPYGVHIYSKEKNEFEIRGKILLGIIEKDIKTSLNITTEEE